MPLLEQYRRVASGKVRDLYEVDERHLLMVASDRISAYDHVLTPSVPDKGRVLTAMSVFWFGLLAAHGIASHLAAPPDDPRVPAAVRGRALLVRRLDMLPVECVVRGYLAGSGTADYRRTGAVCGVALPGGLAEASRLPEPVFTPATKAAPGSHDENVDLAHVARTVGAGRAAELRDRTLAVYRIAAEHARGRGLLLADTKLEFGLDDAGRPVLADEVLTPDSSRYWPADGYAPGRVQPSFDKQYVREWLSAHWDRAAGPPPPLPLDVVAATRERYVEVYERVSGSRFADWPDAPS